MYLKGKKHDTVYLIDSHAAIIWGHLLFALRWDGFLEGEPFELPCMQY